MVIFLLGQFAEKYVSAPANSEGRGKFHRIYALQLKVAFAGK
jgi:hypothetical protein